MAKGKKARSDISNTAIRIFLQMVGDSYDTMRGFERFFPTSKQWAELQAFFNNSCCYCGEQFPPASEIHTDHLVPQNKENLGLHSWGNVVPCCRGCNKGKGQTNWRVFLRSKWTGKQLALREARIEAFTKHYRYDPSLEIKSIAANLYQDVGAVAMTLIELRFKQAEQVISKIHDARPKIVLE